MSKRSRIDIEAPLVSIITVNYFSEKDIIDCYRSIVDKSTIGFEFIIVSNSEVNINTLEAITETSQNILIHETGENLGFAKACNIGARLASGEFLFFLNPDTLFLNDVLLELYHCQKKFSNVGFIGPKTFSDPKTIQPSVKSFISPSFFFFFSIPFLPVFLTSSLKGGHIHLEDTRTVEVLNGHALFTKKQVYSSLNGMEEQFFMYWEENDLCLKAHKKGMKVVFCAEAKLIHHQGKSTSPYFIKMELEKHRSQKKYIQIHLKNYVFLNRLSGILGYSWRALGSLLTFNKTKISQHWSIFLWYVTSYE